MKITLKKGKADKIHISADGEYALTVDEGYLPALGIRHNMEIDEDEFILLQEKISIRRAYNYCVSLLSRRDHSVKELKTKLLQKVYDETAFCAIERLQQQGYVNDESFSVHYASELKNLKDYGKRRIEQELMRKGVSREIINNTLQEFDFDDDRIIEIIERKYKRCFEDEKQKQRAVNGLLRLGYSYGEIKVAFCRIKDNEDFFFSEVEDE